MKLLHMSYYYYLIIIFITYTPGTNKYNKHLRHFLEIKAKVCEKIQIIINFKTIKLS